jgi:two-component system NtrC family sensor kinase
MNVDERSENKMKDGSYYRSLTKNMVLMLMLVSFTPLVLITGMIGYYFETSYRDKVMARLRELVQRHEQKIDGFLHEKLRNIGLVAESYPYEQISDESLLRHLLASFEMVFGNEFVDLGVVNQEGVQIAYAGPFSLRKADYSSADWFKKASQSKYFISEVFPGLRRQPHFIVTVKHGWDSSAWMLRATVDFVAFNSLVESVQMGRTGVAFIMNREGEYQTKPRIEPVLNKDALLGLLKEGKSEAAASESAARRNASTATSLYDGSLSRNEIKTGKVNREGKDYVFVVTPLKSGEWLLVYQQEADEAYSDLGRARLLALFIFVVGGIGIVSMTFVLSRKMVRHIERADREKELMNEQVIRAGKLASIGELAAGIAHEINNPVAIMVEEAGWIEDLLDEEELKKSDTMIELTRALRQIKTQGTRCREITHKLLSFARKTDPKVRELSLNDILEEIIGIAEQMARHGNIRIDRHFAVALPMVWASPSEMQQVFLNLINNAIDAIGDGGGTIDVTTRCDANWVVVDVADSGPGIAPGALSRIFDPFFTTKPVGKGTGLGLSICYGIIRKMEGEITVDSTVGSGTTFHVHIPSRHDGNSGMSASGSN